MPGGTPFSRQELSDMNARRWRRGALILGFAGMLASGLQATPQPATDPLAIPAVKTPLAAVTQLIGVAQAGDRLVAVGWRGDIVYSDDAGQHWTQAPVPVSADLTAVSFPTPRQGWAVGHGGIILHSADAGATWTRQQDGNTTGALMQAYYGQLAATDPAAAKLLDDVKLNYQNGPEQPWLDVWFENERHGIVVGSFNLIMETDDGGAHWKPLMDTVDNPDALHLNSIDSVGGELYIASERGVVFHLDRDSGRFRPQPTGYTGTLFGVTGNDTVVVAYGLAGHALRSLDKGKTWEPVQTGVDTSLTAGCTLPDGRVVLATQGGQLLLGSSRATGFAPIAVSQRALFAGLEPMDKGGLLVVGTHGAQVEHLPQSAATGTPAK